ncbi:uncharacterized protein LOC113280406 [Papaver somniferum]|uniref:uncharacterized protein LOC113280406 n=1 Tax=Papaver somniferum TaxID=3469 RepID=UPI000E6F5913|nr:uncharacterized protein LOC113280406 [Papaver somniferum]
MKQQMDHLISDFHSEMSIIWNQLALMEPNWTTYIELWQKYREESRLVQLLMELRDDFETVRASILHRSPLPTVEAALSELITEETRKRIKPEIPVVFAVPSRISFNNTFSSQRNYRDISQVQCYNCKKPGHLAKNCTLPSTKSVSQTSFFQVPTNQSSNSQIQCNYCKEPGQTVGNCTSPSSRNMRERRRMNDTAYTPVPSILAEPALERSHETSTSTSSNLDDIQEMLKQALAIGNNKSTTASAFSVPTGTFSNGWFLDSGASNHMTFNFNVFENKHPIVTPKIRAAHGRDPRTEKLVGIGRRVGRLYLLETLIVPKQSKNELTVAASNSLPSTVSPFMSWHSKLGHVSFSRLTYMINKGLLGTTQVDKEPYNISFEPFDLIHYDVWGKSLIASKGGALYYIILIDDLSRFTWIYLFSSRSEFLKIYTDFSRMVKTQFRKSIKTFPADQGGEYISTPFKEFLKTEGSLLQLSYTETPEQKGIAERKHRHIIETAKTQLLSASVPSNFWGESILTGVYTINRIPSIAIGGYHLMNVSMVMVLNKKVIVVTTQRIVDYPRNIPSSTTKVTPLESFETPHDHSMENPNIASLERDLVPEDDALPPRARRPPSRFADYHCSLSSILSIHEPKSYREASISPV